MAKIETRGRKPLSNKETTIRAAVCLPESIYKAYVKLGEKSGEGYGAHIRQACVEALKKGKKNGKR